MIRLLAIWAIKRLLGGSSCRSSSAPTTTTIIEPAKRGLKSAKEISAVRIAKLNASSLIMAIWGGVVLTDLGQLALSGSVVHLTWFALPFTVFATIGVINSLNFIDGVDGLAGMVSLITLVGLGIILYSSGDFKLVKILGLCGSVLFAFLLFNWRFSGTRKALVFMGDAGSMFLGFFFAWFFIKISQGDHRVMAPVTALWLFAVPLIDTVTMMIRRILKGRSPFAPDREHFHHLLQMAGFGAKGTTLVILAASTIFAAIGLAGHFLEIGEWIMFYGFLPLFAAYFFTIMHAWKFMRFLKRAIEPRKIS